MFPDPMRKGDQPPGGSPHSLILVGGIFIILGFMAIALPIWATLAVEQLVAGLLLVWGAAGIGFALSMRPLSEWLFTAVTFAMILVIGALFLVVPQDGVATLTFILIAAFLIEGVVSILFALRLREVMPQWGWMLFSGLAALVFGLMILSGWPGTGAWTLGLFVGLNFLTSGISLIALAVAIRSADRK
jgi:uncharacterized membrane protein HdeD (DUF308 family)